MHRCKCIYVYPIYQLSLFFDLARIMTNSQNSNRLFLETNILLF